MESTLKNLCPAIHLNSNKVNDVNCYCWKSPGLPQMASIALLLFFGLLFESTAAMASKQRDAFQKAIYHSYVHDDMEKWKETIADMEAYTRQNPGLDVVYELILARYGLVAIALDREMKTLARHHTERAEKELDILLLSPHYRAEAHALQGAFLGFRISLRPLLAIRLGPRSYSAIERGMEENPNNPIVWMEMGNSRFYTPSTFGGSKEEAAEAYSKAVKLFEKDLQKRHQWLYLNSLIGLAKSYSYIDSKQNEEAAVQAKIKEFEEELKWFP